ncbi:MAG: chitobiase/beta-hexosaminidase C-terminal domain-containing protein [Cytophagales bacterium]|nr:chitobiase/beta-hexosaminidase C-terminal domain-containing protein [Cytophagales bacterium]
MNRIFIFFIAAVLVSCQANHTPGWKPVEGHIVTRWASEVDPANPWPEYPRPQMERKEWESLNGLWNYAIQSEENGKPEKWEGEILVPFPVESALSGVKRKVGPQNKLWYRRTLEIPKSWNGKEILLHFEAVDWECKLWINGNEAGTHRGGYDPFYFNITPYLGKGKNTVVLSVWDPTDQGWQPVGKQVLEPGGIFYTSVTGIWQSVWMEAVSKTSFESFKLIPDIDDSQLYVNAKIRGQEQGDKVIAEAYYEGKPVSNIEAEAGDSLILPVPDAKLWDAGQPNLYDLTMKIVRRGKVIDEVKSYFGMRKISLGKDRDDFTKIMLNGRFLFQNGPLDQGFWPDGIYTPPTEEAMVYDLKKTMEMGFNMLRKHVKIESRRFYYWCDKMGLLVWQDMPNGDKKIGPRDPDITRTEESAKQFEFELTGLIEKHYNHPSIIMWVPFNEGWGQYETSRIVDFVKELDPTRLVSNASGWTDRNVGDIYDVHTYPNPRTPRAEEKRAIVIGEFGGLGLKVDGHMWEEKNWGYQTLNSSEELLAKYEEYYTTIWNDVATKGLSAVIYTQTTDVETEANGLMTYDRALVKAGINALRDINTNNFIPAPNIKPFGGVIRKGDKVKLATNEPADIYYTLDGSAPTMESKKYDSFVVIERDGILKTVAYRDEQKSRMVSTEFKVTSAPKPQYKTKYSGKYTGGGDYALIDGRIGTDNHADGIWQGFEGNDLEVVVELPEVRTVDAIKINFLENTGHWIFLPKLVKIETSADGEKFRPPEEKIFIQPNQNREKRIETADATYDKAEVKFVRLTVQNLGTCPEWHSGKGEKCWFFIDEIVIE